MRIDLHTHTNASDGELSATELLQRAMINGVDMLSITDHDTVAAYQGIHNLGTTLTLIPGIEFSTAWRHTGIHVLGLNVNLKSDALMDGIARQRSARRLRAVHIADQLEKQGINNPLPGVERIAGNDNIGRPHFAAYLVQIGAARSIKHAFDKFLNKGECDTTSFWATLPQVVYWIRESGGIAVIAHPLKYQFTRTKLAILLDDFIEIGGQGMEVISGRQSAQDTRDIAKLCNQKQLLASCGSDFHQPDQPWAEVGKLQPLDEGCRPIWEHF